MCIFISNDTQTKGIKNMRTNIVIDDKLMEKAQKIIRD